MVFARPQQNNWQMLRMKKIFCTYDIILRFKGSLCPQLSECVQGLDIEKH